MAVVTNYTIYSEKQANPVSVDATISIFTNRQYLLQRHSGK